MNKQKVYYQKNRILNYIFGVTWFVLGIYLISWSSVELNILSLLGFIFFIIFPSSTIISIAIRNRLLLDTVNNKLTVRSLFSSKTILIDNITDIKFPRYMAMHLNRFKRALHDSGAPFTKCYILYKGNPDGVLIPFRIYGEKEFKEILDYMKTVNKKISQVEYPPTTLV